MQTRVEATYPDGLRFLFIIQEMLHSDCDESGKIRSVNYLVAKPGSLLSPCLSPSPVSLSLPGVPLPQWALSRPRIDSRPSLLTQHHWLPTPSPTAQAPRPVRLLLAGTFQRSLHPSSLIFPEGPGIAFAKRCGAHPGSDRPAQPAPPRTHACQLALWEESRCLPRAPESAPRGLWGSANPWRVSVLLGASPTQTRSEGSAGCAMGGSLCPRVTSGPSESLPHQHE